MNEPRARPGRLAVTLTEIAVAIIGADIILTSQTSVSDTFQLIIGIVVIALVAIEVIR